MTNPDSETPVTCLGCGCLCDDLTVRVENGTVVSIGVDCDLGLRWFSSVTKDSGDFETLGDALDRAVALLIKSRAPLIFGLTQSSTETVRDALALADRIGAKVWLDRSTADLGRIAAFSEVGRVTATLGEVKNRADLVVYFGADPLTSHPRHQERYSVEPIGRFVGGRENRQVIVVDSDRTRTALAADAFYPCSVDQEYEFLTLVRGLIEGRIPETGVDAALIDLASRLRHAQYGTLFYTSRQPTVAASAACWEAVSDLVRALNGPDRRFVLIGMGSPGNLTGAEAAMTWQAGTPRNLDFRLGFPTPIDESMSLESLIKEQGVDVIVSVGVRSDETECNGVQIIPLDPNPRSSVAIHTARPGIESGGTVMRSDGVALPLRPPLSTNFPSEGEILRKILAKLETAMRPIS